MASPHPDAQSDLLPDIFAAKISRDIPPVISFHEQRPERVAAELAEYIITGGWPEGHPNHRRVPNGIHEQYVRLLKNLAAALREDSTASPALWISGFFGSGKSSFAKLLGLALDGMALPDGRSVSAALLDRDVSPRAAELRAAWAELRLLIEPVAVVFDVGTLVRGDEHLHAVAVRAVQARLGYCADSPHVAAAELAAERNGKWAALEEAGRRRFGQPWSELRGGDMPSARFSALMHELYPELFGDIDAWELRYGGIKLHELSPDEAAKAIKDMMLRRRPEATLFLVVDEVSQFLHDHNDRIERLRAFAEALGHRGEGRLWLVALGQQKIEEGAGDTFLVKLKGRFPPGLRAHLDNTNIRDVVHRRLLHKRPEVEPRLRALYAAHRADLALYAYGCEALTEEEFVEVYPMLPGQIELVLQLTSAMRSRESRAQGDAQAIRGLLQLIGELFRDRPLAFAQVGELVSLDRVYDVLATALDSDSQGGMARVLSLCAEPADALAVRAAKAVALLQLIQSEGQPTDAALVAKALYDRLDRGNNVPDVTAALDALRRRGLLSLSGALGYRLQSSAGEEWARERDVAVSREAISDRVRASLQLIMAGPEKASFKGRSFPWAVSYTDRRRADGQAVLDSRDDACLRVELCFPPANDRGEVEWRARSRETTREGRLVLVCGDTAELEKTAAELHRSELLLQRYAPRLGELSPARRRLYESEGPLRDDLKEKLKNDVSDAFLRGVLYFEGEAAPLATFGEAFNTALTQAGAAKLPAIYPHLITLSVTDGELKQLAGDDLRGVSSKFLMAGLGLLDTERGSYVATCKGALPQRVLARVREDNGASGGALLSAFGSPPYGAPAEVIKACLIGLLRGGMVCAAIDGEMSEIKTLRDPGARELFEKDRVFRRATFSLNALPPVGFADRSRICAFFLDHCNVEIDREDHPIADAVVQVFPRLAGRLNALEELHRGLPDPRGWPPALERLGRDLVACVVRSREAAKTVEEVLARLPQLNDGMDQLRRLEGELSSSALAQLRRAANVRDHQLAQLEEVGLGEAVAGPAAALRAQLGHERPWFELGAIGQALVQIDEVYVKERSRRLAEQGALSEAGRHALKRRAGFATLTADQQHEVLRPLTLALTVTTPEATAPTLSALDEAWRPSLQRAIDRAGEALDKLLSRDRLIVRFDPQLRDRELSTEAEVEQLLAELRGRLLQQLGSGNRVRIT